MKSVYNLLLTKILPTAIGVVVTTIVIDLFLSYYILGYMISIIPGWHTTVYDMDSGWKPGFQTVLAFLLVGLVIFIYSVIKYLMNKLIKFLQSKFNDSRMDKN